MQEEKPNLEALRIDHDEPESGRRLSPVGWVFIGLLIVVGIAAVWFVGGQPVEVRTQTARALRSATGARVVLNASGYVVARREATVSSKITGKVIEVLVEEGMRVEAGQVLARLDTSNVVAELRLSEAQLEATRSALTETEVRLEESERELSRVEALKTDGVATEAESDRAEAEMKSLRARLQLQRQQIDVAQRQVNVLEQHLEDTVIRAPFSGVAVSKDAQPGEMISPVSAGGGFTRTGIGTIVDMDSLEIEVDVNESYIKRVTPDQEVEASLDAYPDWKIPCRVIAIIPTADRQKATVRVRVGFNQLDPRILPQMGVKVSFLATADETQPEEGVRIARSALRQGELGDAVWVVADGRIVLRTVTVAMQDAEQVTITAGLEAGERVVVEGPLDLAPGTRVREAR